MGKRKRGSRKNSTLTQRKDTKHKDKGKEKRETKRRRREEEKQSMDFPIPEDGNPLEKKKAIFCSLEKILSEVKSSKNYRTPKSRNKVVFSACVGYTSNTFGLNGFKDTHPQKERRGYLGVCPKGPENKRTNKWLRKIWDLSKQLMPLYDPLWGNGYFLLFYMLITYLFLEYCVHVSKITKKCSDDHLHKETRDISPAYVLYLGDFKGATLRCFDESGKVVLSEMGEPYCMARFDPRLPHSVIRGDNFHGNRYCLVFFKMWDTVSDSVRPLELCPGYLEPNVFSPVILWLKISLELFESLKK